MNTNMLSILRFTAAIIVILFHQRGRFDYLNALPNIFVAGPQMCTFFFVLSGFVLSISYTEKSNIDQKEFITKRLERIYPIYLISVALVIPIIFIEGKMDFLNIIINLTLIQSWIPPYPLSINGPAWFLSTLFFGYITFIPLINRFRRIDNAKHLLMLALSTWAITQIVLSILLNSSFYRGFPSVSHDLIYYFPLAHYCSFLFGVVGGFLLKKRDNTKQIGYRNHTLLFISLGLIVIIINNQDAIVDSIGFNLPFCSSLYAPMFLLLISSLFGIRDIFINSHFVWFIEFLGAVSFPMYILQRPVSSYVFHFLKIIDMPEILKLVTYMILLVLISALVMRIAKYPFILFSKISKLTFAQQ